MIAEYPTPPAARSCYGRSMIRTVVSLLVLLGAADAAAKDLQSALEHIGGLVETHRYQEIVDLLTQFTDLEDPESRYAVSAELGRAYFHLGDYAAADQRLREAVSLRPQRVETALYLEATSYLLGNRGQAYAIFREIIASGATDLYLAVTLPGERRFLADPQVRSILDELSRRLAVDVDRGSVLEVELGLPQSEVERLLKAPAGGGEEALTARAGPFLTWAFAFDETSALTRIMLHNENLYRYTPYRIQLMGDVDWRASPAIATGTLGAPESTTSTEDGLVMMSWLREHVRLTMEFSPPRSPVPFGFQPDEPVLRVVRLEALQPQPAP